MRRHGWFAALVTLTVLGCGTEGGIFSEGEAGAGAGGTSTGNGGDDPSTSSTGGAPSTSSTGGDPNTSSSTGGAPNTSSSTGGDGGAPSTSSTGTGGDMLPPVDCGNELCKIDGDSACCWDNYQFYGQPQGECVMGTVETDGCQTSAMGEPQAAGAETRIECQGPVHCAASETCCGELRSAFAQGQQIFFYESVTCQQACAGNQEVPLCDPTAATPCPLGGNCQQSSLLPTGYFVCAN